MKKANGFLLLLLVSIGLAACTGENKTTTLFTADANIAKSILDAAKADVAIEDMEHFYVTITKIQLDRSGNGNSDDTEAEGEDTEKAEGEAEGEDTISDPSKIIVFEGELEVDLLDLLGVSEVISSAEVPPGDYTKLRLSIANPRLVLASDPETEITDVHLTANSRLFVSQKFTIPEGNTLLILDFGGVKLVQLGNGGYNLTPQLDVELTVQSADVQSSGTVVSFDGETLVITLEDGSELSIAVTAETAFLPNDTDPPASADGLTVGATVSVEGTMFVDGSITATTITLGL